MVWLEVLWVVAMWKPAVLRGNVEKGRSLVGHSQRWARLFSLRVALPVSDTIALLG